VHLSRAHRAWFSRIAMCAPPYEKRLIVHEHGGFPPRGTFRANASSVEFEIIGNCNYIDMMQFISSLSTVPFSSLVRP
jgi:hypothetical protein